MSDLPAFLAEQMGVSRRTVQRWFDAGKIQGAYRTRGGHWRLRKPRGRLKKLDKIAELVMLRTTPLRPGRPMTRIGSLKLRLAMLEWRLVAKMDELLGTQRFNDALEFSSVAKGICNDDKLPRGLKDIPREERSRVVRQHFQDLEKRDPEKFRYLIGERDTKTGHVRPTPIREFINEDAYDAIRQRHGMLMVKAEKLRLDLCEVTPKFLARELGMSVATLYRRYGRQHVKRACQGWSDYALPNDAPPIPQTTREARRNEQIRQRVARFEIRS